MDLAQGKIGAEGDYDVTLAGGKLKITAEYTGAGGGAGVSLTLDAKYFLEKLKVAIPGNWDDLVIDLAEKALP